MSKTSILQEADVRRLRDLASRKMLDVKMEAMFYGVAAETIRRAVRGETWTKLSMAPPRTEEELNAEAAASYEKLQRLFTADKERKEAGTKMLDEITAPIKRSPLDE